MAKLHKVLQDDGLFDEQPLTGHEARKQLQLDRKERSKERDLERKNNRKNKRLW